jgi:hypothetical protein
VFVLAGLLLLTDTPSWSEGGSDCDVDSIGSLVSGGIVLVCRALRRRGCRSVIVARCRCLCGKHWCECCLYVVDVI